jgi:hypothetical protein
LAVYRRVIEGIVMLSRIGGALKLSSGKDVALEFAAITKRPLPLVCFSSIAAARAMLRDERISTSVFRRLRREFLWRHKTQLAPRFLHLVVS